MVENVITALEFDEVLKLLAAESVTPPGVARATKVVPAYDPESVDRENRLAAEMTRRIEAHGLLPFGVVPDASPLLSRLEIEGAVLAPLEVFDLVTLMKAGRTLKSALAETRAEFPRLWDIAGELPDLGNLVRFLDGKIAPTGELEDGASDDLRAVRLEIRRRNERLDAALVAIAGRAEVARALQDTFISIRSDRHVIPIRAESQSAVPGSVHGVSGEQRDRDPSRPRGGGGPAPSAGVQRPAAGAPPGDSGPRRRHRTPGRPFRQSAAGKEAARPARGTIGAR
ncbi:MAG: hypothetical protein AUI47_12190 [Acidobacteria bacterium 13_1_40CM_2_68_5]|nr:MAG: hypothetical protein AUI47_12190 [Acidobacteria bacterium 13_1_40CM_2_68_5]